MFDCQSIAAAYGTRGQTLAVAFVSTTKTGTKIPC